MDSSLRASAFAGVGAFVLSIIVAVFSRVPLGVLVLRALASGIGFGALVFGAQVLMRRFLPELFDGYTPEAAEASPSMGSLVDIVVSGGDEVLTDLPPAERSGEAPLAMERDDAVPHRPETIDPQALAREVADLRQDVLVSAESAESGVDSGGSSAPRPSVALDELDTLPDLDSLSDSFSETGLGGAPYDDDTPGGQGMDATARIGPSDSMPSAGAPDAGKDPAVLAKAVQTLLRRDQKGQ
ncbi:MAG: hypothetical protein JXM71_02015 [Spirochaetales bacterium]|nr:hypothetical protein [Spirochaetales bacterium]